PQTGLTILPTRSVYSFSDGHVRATLTFTSPLLPEDLDLLSRPASYVSWEVAAADRQRHNVEIYFDAGGELAVNTPDQRVTWKREQLPGLEALRCGSEEQPVLRKSGDNLRIDWGYLYLAAPSGMGTASAIGDGDALRSRFSTGGRLPERDDTRMPRA